jgi:neutral ceramidase
MAVRDRRVSGPRPGWRWAAVPAVLASVAGSTGLGEATARAADSGYLIGTGVGDITGEAAEVGMFGYSQPSQRASGIQSRQWARAFVIAQADGKRVAFVNTDLGMIAPSVQQGVMRKLRARFGDDRYTDANVTLSATHTHSGPAGYTHELLYNIPSLGHNKATYDAIVDGITDAVIKADTVAPGKVKIATGELHGASINRSAAAFVRNGPDDRAAFPGAVDPKMTVLRFERGGKPVGMISWFATHGTSMTNTNTLISPDNKGYAEYYTEHDIHHLGWQQRGEFVAAFAQGAAGDMSPNTRGGGKGPTDDETENTKIIGRLQADKAKDLFDQAAEELHGPIDFRQRYLDFGKIPLGPGRGSTCPAALGQGFTAGASDGPALDWIRPGQMEHNPLLVAVGAMLTQPSQQLRDCQAPKPVMLATGTQDIPWTPQILPVQILRIGNTVITAAPAEFTVTAGKHLTEAVASELRGVAQHVIFAGYSNSYAGYVTTPEEYDAQLYEGASTHFGRLTSPAYNQEFAKLAQALRDGSPTPSTVQPAWLGDRQMSLETGVVFDDKPIVRQFGDVLQRPASSYRQGEKVQVSFITGHPKNNLLREGTFLEVQRLDGSRWTTVAVDNDFETTYRWRRIGIADSAADITWSIPKDAPAGTYRILHHGDWKNGWTGSINSFTGDSGAFRVGAP